VQLCGGTVDDRRPVSKILISAVAHTTVELERSAFNNVPWSRRHVHGHVIITLGQFRAQALA
jgi:hypothetical protein